MTAKTRALVGLAAVAVAAGPGASVATAGLWSAPANLGAHGGNPAGDVAVDADGTAVVAWADAGDGHVSAAVRPAGSAFGPTKTLAADGGVAAAVGLDGRGGALVAWSRNGSLELAERTRDRPELTAVPIAVGGVASWPDVAFVASGRAVVVWAGTDGAVHALSRELGGETVALPDLAPGPGNSGPYVEAAGGNAVVTWTATATTGSDVTTRVRASVRTPGGAFGPAEDVASATGSTGTFWSGSRLTATGVAVSEGGAADVSMAELEFLGPPGDTALAGRVAARTAGAWTEPQRLGGADGLIFGGAYTADVAAGPAGDALYVDGTKPSHLATMTFSARLRSAGAVPYGGPSTLDVVTPGEIRAAPLKPSRFLVVIRSGTGIRSRAGSAATGFADPLTFRNPDARRLLGLAGAPTGLAVAAWSTTTGRVHAAVYDDSLGSGSLPPAAAPDGVAPVLTRLAVAPKRFTARRKARIRWRLSEPARVRLRVDRVRRGFRRAGRCVGRRPRAGRVRRCERFRRVGALTRVGRAGRTTVRFDRFVRSRGLLPGRYRVTAYPRDAAGNRGKIKRTRFTIVPRR